jgi:hypothetical protein
VRLLVDTHLLLWAIAEPNRISKPVRVRIESPDNEVLIDVARCFAQCSAAAGEADELQAVYAKKAIDALDNAIAHGYRDAVYLECEPDLDPLRKHDDFNTAVEKAKQSN